MESDKKSQMISYSNLTNDDRNMISNYIIYYTDMIVNERIQNLELNYSANDTRLIYGFIVGMMSSVLLVFVCIYINTKYIKFEL